MSNIKAVRGPGLAVLGLLAALSIPAPAAAEEPTFGIGFAGVRLVSHQLTLTDRYVTVRLTCPLEAVGGCAGTTKVAARSHATLGRGRFAIASGAKATVKVRITDSARHRLAHVRRLRALVTNDSHSGAGESATAIASVTIRRG
jgi:hypothetical protein